MNSCPRCGSHTTVKNGRTQQGKQNHKCKLCGRQFVADPQGRISDQVKQIVDKMLQEADSARKIHKRTGISLSWIYGRKRAAVAE